MSEGEEAMEVSGPDGAVATQIVPVATLSSDVIAKAINSIKAPQYSVSDVVVEDGAMKLIASNGMMVASRDPDEVQASQPVLSASNILGSDVVPLSVVDEQPIVSSPFEPGVIYVGQSDGQLSMSSDHSLLLSTDSNVAALSLDHGELMSHGDHTAEIGESQQLVPGQDEGEQFTILQNTADGTETASKFIAVSPQALGLNGNMLTSGANSGTIFGESGIKGNFQNLMMKTATGETVQVIAIPNFISDLAKNKLVQVGQANQLGSSDQVELIKAEGEDASGTSQVLDIGSTIGDSLAGILVTPVVQRVLPPGTPGWAARLNECEKIGDSYRGWVETEIDLDLLLTYHKQQTHSFWGTRQSPSPAKPSTRLMWKSQYVPFDGIPFINAGSRAIVLECQFGPRRKGSQSKRQTEIPKSLFKQTCPARIYIKKVKKYPGYAVDINTDKKLLKLAMDKAFLTIRGLGSKAQGQERYYIQLPTEGAHEFHGDTVVESPHRLDTRVADKVRDLVSGGETRLYAIRKALRKFVEKEIFSSAEEVPEKHNLTFYPTVNDLQNHIHQAVRDIEAGMLPVTASTVKVEMVTDESSSEASKQENFPLWQQLPPMEGQPHTESVTVTLTQSPGEDGEHVISKVETHLSDGTTQVSTNLTLETARLLSKLHPNMFPGGALVPVGEDLPESPKHELIENLPSGSVADQLATNSLTDIPMSSLSGDMAALAESHPQYVVVQTEAHAHHGEPLTLGEGASVVEIDPDMQIQEHTALDVSMEADNESSFAKLVHTKLPEQHSEDLGQYTDCMCLNSSDDVMSGEEVVAKGLQHTMESSVEHVGVLTVTVNQ